jgi:transcriptional regulator with XRE-family HTH domain
VEGVGTLLARWRKARGRSELALSLDAGVSARHLGFVELGRSRPSRETVLRLAEVLDVPLRDRNTLLTAGGFAPAFPERALSDPEMQQLREVLSFVLAQHEPFPAIVVDRRYDVVMRNDGGVRLFAHVLGPFPAALAERPNSLRLVLHPEGLRRVTANWMEVATSLLRQLHRAAHAGDPDLVTLYDELSTYLGVPSAFVDPAASGDDPVVVPLHLRTPTLDVRLLSMLTTIARAHDVTVQELRIESLVPADARRRRRCGRHLRRSAREVRNATTRAGVRQSFLEGQTAGASNRATAVATWRIRVDRRSGDAGRRSSVRSTCR